MIKKNYLLKNNNLCVGNGQNLVSFSLTSRTVYLFNLWCFTKFARSVVLYMVFFSLPFLFSFFFFLFELYSILNII